MIIETILNDSYSVFFHRRFWLLAQGFLFPFVMRLLSLSSEPTAREDVGYSFVLCNLLLQHSFCRLCFAVS